MHRNTSVQLHACMHLHVHTSEAHAHTYIQTCELTCFESGKEMP